MLVLSFNIIFKSYQIYIPTNDKSIFNEIGKRTSAYLSERILMNSVPLLGYTFENEEVLLKQDMLRGYETSIYKNFFSSYIPLIDYVLKEDSPTYYTVVELYPVIEFWQLEDEDNKLIEEAELEIINKGNEKNIDSHTNQVPDNIARSPVYNLNDLKDFNFMLKNIYTVDPSIYLTESDLKPEQWLTQDMTVDFTGEEPKVLIYHTHSQEAFLDSRNGFAQDTVVGLGEYLTEVLESQYGIKVLHHKGVYDYPLRDRAYANAVSPITKILEENPSIEIVIDLHRDGVRDETIRFVTEIEGETTAKIMFFNGLSKTTANGKMTPNTYLPNPYVSDNIALSLQMHLKAEELYPGITRKIYVRGERYNLHLKPKSLLIELGANSNTIEEARNAIEPLARVIYEVFSGK